MRFAAALAVFLFGGTALAQTQPTVIAPEAPSDGTILVPPPPPIAAAPATPAAPLSPSLPAASPPPGLVTASPPADAGNADDGTDGSDGGSAGAATGQNAAGSPAGNPVGAQPADQDAIPALPDDWQPGQSAVIGVLDKVAGGTKQIALPVGGRTVVGDLQVAVLACVLRPAGQIPDAAIFLALQDAANPASPPQYRGWLIRSAPGAAIAGDASEVFRVVGCR